MNLGGGNGENGSFKFPMAYVPHLIYALTIIFGGGAFWREQADHGRRIDTAEVTIEKREHRLAQLEADALVVKAQQTEQDRRIENLETLFRAHTQADEYYKAFKR